MKSLKIKLVFLSVFVFCMEQNNIVASPYGRLPEGEKREKTKKEKIQEWMRKNWGYLKWVLGGLAVGGAGFLAHKKGYFGGSGSCSVGGGSGGFVPIKKREFVVVKFLKKNLEKQYNDQVKDLTDENEKRDLTEKHEAGKNKLDELENINEHFFSLSNDGGILNELLLYKLLSSNEDFKKNNNIFLNFKANVKSNNSKFMYNLDINQKLAHTYFTVIQDIYNKKDLAEFADYKDSIKNDKTLQELFVFFDEFDKHDLKIVFDELLKNINAIVKSMIEKKEDIVFADGLKNALRVKLLEYKDVKK